MPKRKLPVTEELDFAYLLELMHPMHNHPEFAWLPELFSIIGHDKLLLLCKYAGGEVIRIPTLEELSLSIDALQWFYDVHIKHSRQVAEVPVHLHSLFHKIWEVYSAREHQGSDPKSSDNSIS